MHTSEHEHIKRGKERKFLFYFFLYCLFFYLPLSAICRQSNSSLLASSGIPRRTTNDSLLPVIADSRLFRAFTARLTGRPPPSQPILNLRSSCVSTGVYTFRPFHRLHCLDGRSKKLYALYASKTRLCALCEDTTPKLTAYNAYRNASRRVRRAENTKMYAVRDAYKAHTSAYRHIKVEKERNSSSTSSLYCLFLYLYCLRSQAFTDPIKPHCPFF